MYRVNPQEAQIVENHIKKIFESLSVRERAAEVGRLFVEALDFGPADRRISLANARGPVILPEDAHHVASLDTAHVVYVALDISETDRVRKAEAAEAARLISRQLDGDLLLVFTNTSSQPTPSHLSHLRGQTPDPAAYGRRAVSAAQNRD